MKRIPTLFFSLILFLLLALPCLASGPRTAVPGSVDIPDTIADRRGDRLVDQAALLTEEEETALRDKLDDLSEALRFDVVIVTAERIGSRTPMEFADDYFDYNGFGYNDTFDGCLLLISMEGRDWWISTCGFGETALPDDYFLTVVRNSAVLKELKNNNYDAAFHAFADMVGDFVREAQTGRPYSSRHRYQDWKNKLIGACVSLAAGLIAGAVVTVKMRNRYVSVVRNETAAGSYIVGSVVPGASADDFIRTVSNRTPRTQSGGGASRGGKPSYGSHISSSGRSHGGGGGKF